MEIYNFLSSIEVLGICIVLLSLFYTKYNIKKMSVHKLINVILFNGMRVILYQRILILKIVSHYFGIERNA